MKVKMEDGYEVEIMEAHLNDWKMLKMLRGIDKGEAAMIVDVVDLLLGEEQSAALEEHLEANGITSIDAMVDAVRQIMEAANELKNS